MRVLILGGSGMLGHKLAQVLAPRFETIVSLRGPASDWPAAIPAARVIGGCDVGDPSRLAQLLDACAPQAALNAVGVIKQVIGAEDRVRTVAINALFPNVLAELCKERGIRLVHYSTDCVFSGARDSRRGPAGYRESDPPDARDLYGSSKLLGEPADPHLVLRTSIIGRELRGRHGLLEWCLAQRGTVRGYTRALFTGLTTPELARLTASVLHEHTELAGLFHVAAAPISKHDLLGLVNAAYGLGLAIVDDDSFDCDRRLDGARFAAATGWRAPDWPAMVQAMRHDPFAYLS